MARQFRILYGLGLLTAALAALAYLLVAIPRAFYPYDLEFTEDGLRCGAFRLPVTCVTRLRLDAALYDPPPPPQPSRRGRKPKKGVRQLSLAARAADPDAPWIPLVVIWYDQQPRRLQILSGTALWYTPGCEPLPIRWVLVHDPAGQLRDHAFLCTEQTTTPEQILQLICA